MNKMKRYAGFAGAAAVAGALLLTQAPAANAAAPTPDWSHARAFLVSHGASVADQNRVIAELAAGKVTLSVTKGAIPVSSTTTTSPEVTATTDHFADGSIRYTEIQLNSPAALRAQARGVQPDTIAGCHTTSGAGYSTSTGCTISAITETVNLQFKGGYSKYQTGAEIISVSTPQATTNYGGCDAAPTLSIIRKNQDGNLPAVATEHCHFVSYNGQGSEDLYLSLRVTSGGAYTTNY